MPEQRLSRFTILSLAGVFALGVVLLYFLFGQNILRPEPTSLSNIVDDVRGGRFEEALTRSLSIQADPTKSADERALALYSSLGVQYRLTGDPKTRLVDIQNMKKIILDPAVSLPIRVDVLNTLAGQYSISGRIESVFIEIYKDTPFDQYLVKGEPDFSARKLYEWSYSMLPTSNAAIGIARWYTEQVFVNSDQTRNTTEEYATTAEEWLGKADVAAAQEAAEDATYADSTRYLVYRYWRAMIIGRLATQKGEPYSTDYRAEFENFFTFAQSQKNTLAEGYLLYGRLFYAQRLMRMGDRATAKTQVDLLGTALNAVSQPETSVFIRYLESESKRNGVTWRGISSLFAISSSFKEAVEKVLAKKEG